jgi:hypothetical protein
VTAHLPPDAVLEIFRRAHAGETAPTLAAEFGVKPKAIARIKNGRSWGELTGMKPPKPAKPTTPPPPHPRPSKSYNKNYNTSASRALREAYGGRGSQRGMRAREAALKPKPPTLEEMLAHNPSALSLLEGAKALRAKREADEQARHLADLESWQRLEEARAKRKAQRR